VTSGGAQPAVSADPLAASVETRGVLGRSVRWVPALGVFVLVVAAWEGIVRADVVNELILPLPTEIAKRFVELFSTGIVWGHLEATVVETLAGFGLGVGAAFVLGLGAGMWRAFGQIVAPYVVTFQVTPRVALAPIFLTWFGFGLTSKIVMAATICFFPVYINTLAGLAAVDPQARELFRSLRASRMQELLQLSLPTALPVVFAGIKTAMTLALIGAIVAEFVGASEGLGFLIDRYNFRLATDSAFAVVLLLAVIGLALYGAMEWLDRRIVFWRDRV
jgi:NitT/TauT family transport system permease protein